MKNKAIVLESNPQEIEELARKWRKRKRLGERLVKLGGSGLFVSLLSPFDFEGPVAEIVTAAIAAVGYGIKEAAEYNLENLEEERESLEAKRSR